MTGSPELQVLMPYSQVVQLLKAADKVDTLTDQLTNLSDQQAALRSQFIELMEKFKELI